MSVYRILSETNTITKATRWVVERCAVPIPGPDWEAEVVGVCGTEGEAEELIAELRINVAWVRDE